MASSSASVTQQRQIADPLAYLPCAKVVEFKKGEVIYGHDRPCNHLYLVLSGSVKITRVEDHGRQFLLDLYGIEEFFGESSLLNLSDTSERAMAHQRT